MVALPRLSVGTAGGFPVPPSGRPRNLEDWLDFLAERIPPLSALRVMDSGTEKFDASLMDRLAPLRRFLSNYFGVKIEGADHLPKEGGALLVANHGRTGLDALIFPSALGEKIGRPVYGLADKAWFRVPAVRDWFAAMGGVTGTRENATNLLRAGNLVLVYPGGANEVLKPAHEAYTLSWDDRTGFVRVAMEADVPIFPVAGIGVEELYYNLPGWDQIERSDLARWVEEVVGRRYRGMPPLVGLGPLPNPVALTFKIGEAVSVSGIDPPDEAAILSIQRQVKMRVERLIAEGRREKNGKQTVADGG